MLIKWLIPLAAIASIIILCSGDYKRYGGREDIVESMYSDVVDGNQSLKQLEKELDAIEEDHSELVSRFDSYKAVSTTYYGVAAQKAKAIGDTVLEVRMQKLLSESEARFRSRISLLESLMMQLQQRSITINDYHLAVKLVMTLPELEKRQEKELPSHRNYEELKGRMDQQVKQMETIIKK